MVFTPRFQEASDSLIVDNILTVVKRDFKAALDYYYPTAPLLPDFAQRTLGEFVRLGWPAFAISPDSNTPTQSADGSWIEETLKVKVIIGVTSTDAPTATRLAMKYIRAFKSVIRSASVADYSAGFPANSIFAITTEVSYSYGLIAQNATAWEKLLIADVLLKFNER